MPKLSPAEIESIVRYQPPNDQAIKKHTQVRDVIHYAMEQMNHELPDCRELSVVNTKLEEAMYFANAAIARNHDKL